MSETPASSPPAAPASSGSAVRLVILIALLLVVVGLFAYDRQVAAPGSEAAYEKLEKFVEEENAKGVDDATLVRSADVQKALGMAPTFVDEHKDYTVEYYCWFGKIPVLNTWKRYLTVVYVSDSRRYDAHYKNEKPPADSLPGYLESLPVESVEEVELSNMPGGGGGPAPDDNAGEGDGGKKKGGKKKGGDAPMGDAPTGDAPAGTETPATETPPTEPPATETPAPEGTEPAAPPAEASPEPAPAEPKTAEPAATEDQPEAEAKPE